MKDRRQLDPIFTHDMHGPPCGPPAAFGNHDLSGSLGALVELYRATFRHVQQPIPILSAHLQGIIDFRHLALQLRSLAWSNPVSGSWVRSRLGAVLTLDRDSSGGIALATSPLGDSATPDLSVAIDLPGNGAIIVLLVSAAFRSAIWAPAKPVWRSSLQSTLRIVW
jgi:hypothetical protein